MPGQEILQEPFTNKTGEDAAIALTLDKILEARGRFADKMAEEAKAMERIAKKAEKLEQAADVLRQLKKEEREDLFGSKETCSCFDSCMEKAKECREKAQKAALEFQALDVRFRRKTVNIGVIGRQGAGKSRILQTLSGLGDQYIPSGDGPSCTGVTCVIENVPGLAEPEIYFNLKDEETLCRELNREIGQLWKEITGSAGGSPQLAEGTRLAEKPDSIFQKIGGELNRRHITKGLTYNRYKILKSIYCDQWDKWRPLAYPARPERETEDGRNLADTEWQIRLDHWNKQMENWRGGIRRYPLEILEESQWVRDGVPRCRLRDTKQVTAYIKKWNVAGKDSSEIYDFNCYHVAIREAVIRIAFGGVDARVSLIDTVGIGDSSADTRDRMNRAIDMDSDGLIFIHKYLNQRTFVSKDELDELKNICHGRLLQRPGDWTAFLVNVYAKTDCSSEWIQNYFETGVRAAKLQFDDHAVHSNVARESGAALEEYIKELSEYGEIEGLFCDRDASPDGQYITMRCAANGMDPDTIKGFLNQFLQQISRSLGQVDTRRRAGADSLRMDAERVERELKKQLRTLCIPSGDHLDMVSKWMGDRRKKLRESLSKYYEEILMEDELKSPLETYQAKIDSMLNAGGGKDFLKDIAVSAWEEAMPDKRRARLLALENLYLQIRRITSEACPDHRKKEEQFKVRLAEELVNMLGIDLSKTGREEPVRITDQSFFESMKEILFSETADTGDLPEFFDSIHNFHLDDSVVMAKAVICHTAARHLCTYTVPELLEEKDFHQDRQMDSRRRNSMDDDLLSSYRAQAANRAKGLNGNGGGDGNVEEIRDMLSTRLGNLTKQLEAYLEAEKSYSVAPRERLREELMNFIMCFGEPYRETWLRVFNKMYGKGAILQGEMSEFQRIRNKGDRIRGYVDEYLGGVQQ